MIIGRYRGRYLRYSHARLTPTRLADSVKLNNIAAQDTTSIDRLYTVKLMLANGKNNPCNFIDGLYTALHLGSQGERAGLCSA